MRKDDKYKKNDSVKSVVERRQLAFHQLFNNNIDEIDDLLSQHIENYKIHNKLVDIRNQCTDFISDSLAEITALIKHKVDIQINSKKKKEFPVKEYNKPCQICGEKRIINYCHIIPRSEGGDNDAGNILLLCPTHHFLFDHARLTKSEFNKISLSQMLDESKAYFISVHQKRHELKWKYQTNRFKGCDCGSSDFVFIPYREHISVKVALKCDKCGEIWLNLWEETHPITKAEITVCDDYEDITDSDRNTRLDKAEVTIREFIDKEVPYLTKSDS